jgi:hypothetical protein
VAASEDTQLELQRLAAEVALIKAIRDLVRNIKRMNRQNRELHDEDDD